MRDWIIDAFGSAVSDIEAKIIKEAYFERRTSDQQDRCDPQRERDDDEDRDLPDSELEPEAIGHDLDRGIDL